MEDVRHVAEAFVQAFNGHDEGRIRELNADDSVVEAPGDVRVEGREPATQYAMSWLRAFPNGGITVQNQLEADDQVVQEFTFEGDHQGTLQSPGGDIPATGRHLKGRGVQVLRIRGGEVIETRLYFDQVQVLTQLGLMPEPAAD